MRKRQRTMDMHNSNPADPSQQQPPPVAAAAAAQQQQQPGQQPQSQPPITEDGFIQDNDAVDSAVEDDDEEEKPKSDKKAGRRKIKIEFIQDKSRRHITFSKRKAGVFSPPSSSILHSPDASLSLSLGIMKKVILIFIYIYKF
jgi:pheromone receptor transcription factor